MPLPPLRGPRICPVQAIPGGYHVGDVVFSIISHSDEHGSFKSGAEGKVTGLADTDQDTELKVEFEGYARLMGMPLTQISRDPDPNNVGDDYCTARPPCIRQWPVCRSYRTV